jgi:Domain of Unknown Function (DUF1080)/Polymer-forming cytoskeletal
VDGGQSIRLGPNDRIEGSLTFHGDVVVEGKVEGELRLTGLLALRGSGAVLGNVRVSRLTVEEGATLHGNIRMGNNGHADPVPSVAEPAKAVPEAPVSAMAEAPATVVASEPEGPLEVAPAPVVATAVAVEELHPAQADEEGFIHLFDGQTKTGWRLAGAGDFRVADDALEAVPDPGGELGLLWHGEPTPRDFVLKVEWKLGQKNDNSGVHLRFPDPGSRGYLNQAWVGVDYGFEVQIDEYGWPDRGGKHKTGAIYDQEGQTLSQKSARPPGQWNEFEIRARGQEYTVLLNGHQVCRFRNRDKERGLPSAPGAPAYVGLQVHPPLAGQADAAGRVSFRNIRIKRL